jgi:hypothetical protein
MDVEPDEKAIEPTLTDTNIADLCLDIADQADRVATIAPNNDYRVEVVDQMTEDLRTLRKWVVRRLAETTDGASRPTAPVEPL